MRDRNVERGHWKARDDTSALLRGPLGAGLSRISFLQIPASQDVISGLKQYLPQLNSQHFGNTHQRVEGRFALAPVQQADGGLVESAPIS